MRRESGWTCAWQGQLIADAIRLGNKCFRTGETFVILRQQGGWTYGALTCHVWSIVGDDARADVSSTFLQRFFAYTTKSGWTLNANSDSTKNWTTCQWSVPLNIFLTKLVRVAGQPVNVGGGARCWATAPPGGLTAAEYVSTSRLDPRAYRSKLL
jgi:hypothetical protein